MNSLHKSAIFLAICLSALAGCVDAIGFLQLGGYFISFMSGNSTQLAVGIAIGQWQRILLPGEIIALFVIGTMLGTWVGHFSKAATHAFRVLTLVTFLLAGAAICQNLGLVGLAIALMILAMGAENAVFQRGGDVVVGLTYMTGTLVKMGQRLANLAVGGNKFAWIPYLLLWLGLISGGAVGALLFQSWGLNSLWIAVIWAALLTLVTKLMRASLPT